MSAWSIAEGENPGRPMPSVVPVRYVAKSGDLPVSKTGIASGPWLCQGVNATAIPGTDLFNVVETWHYKLGGWSDEIYGDHQPPSPSIWKRLKRWISKKLKGGAR